jgi:hypothetical protein
MDNDEKALNYMCKYCGIDVRRLESVYKDLSAFAPVRTHAGVLGGRDKWTCPRTGSTNVEKSKTRVTANGTVQHQMRSLDDGTYFSISNTAYEQYLKAKQRRLPKV